MNFRREFEIAFVGLKPGLHHFEYRIDDKFFANYEKQDFSNCNATVKLELDKKSGFMLLKFDVDGSVDVNCDRCGNPLTLQLWDEFKVMVKLVDNPDEMNAQEEDPDVYYISHGESHLHLADWIYEFINLSIPLQKICPPDEAGNTQCNKEVLAKLSQAKSAGKSVNPVWEALNKFKDLK
ncbi:YceD family protein [Parafilimonas sp.]|uniref:YceD family protein n=1 Tax=Parafilimonas sp. TaxID=1969739 RepID=UPI0039E2D5F8